MNIDFCFRLEPETNMAFDTETGEKACAYCKITFENIAKLPKTEEEYAELHDNARNYLAEQINVDSLHITPITFKEWAENQED